MCQLLGLVKSRLQKVQLMEFVDALISISTDEAQMVTHANALMARLEHGSIHTSGQSCNSRLREQTAMRQREKPVHPALRLVGAGGSTHPALHLPGLLLAQTEVPLPV